MSNQQLDEEVIFHIARKLEDPADREKYLDQICAGDVQVRERVDALLAVHDRKENFLKSHEPYYCETLDHPSVVERVGTSIDRFRLMEQIGEGGMGIVFVADQERPIRRKVALKVIKPGMDSKAVVARFEAERQALAMMDHPNIARVLDAGTTESGRPYFVMELVKGVPITEYCDGNRLTLPKRLELFIQVCHAIQHAHQKGIIHRDIKPSNVLVTLHDGKPVPKVIDFGVAKALNARLTDRTIYTEHLQVVGTLLYMSPEQAELSGLDVDTRSDIYSLGVLLYELLTGTTPFLQAQLDQAGIDEQRRMIREQEPPRASVRISSLGETAAAVAEHRKTDPRKLNQTVRGDLDWILLKALEKDRTRRYETASSFASDVLRHLEDEPVQARPPSTAYRLRKLAARNRRALVTATIVVTALIVALACTTWMTVRLNRTLVRLQDATNEQAVVAALIGDSTSAENALKVAGDAGANSTKLKVLNGLVALNSGDYVRAVEIAQEVLTSNGQHIGARALLATARLWGGYVDEWSLESRRLAKLSPKCDPDRLLMAHALVLHDSNLALRLVSDTERMDRSPVALLLRGQDLIMRADDTQNPDLYQKAVRDFEYVHWLLPDNPNVVAWRANALAHAIKLAKRLGEDTDSLGKDGHELLRELSVVEGNPFLDWSRWKLCRALGDNPGASAAIRRAGQHGYFCWYVAVDCLVRHESSAAAAKAFDHAMRERDEADKYVRLARAFMVHDLPDESEQVRQLVEEMTNDQYALNRMFALCGLCLAGDAAYDQRLAARNDESKPIDTGNERFANRACLDYLAQPTASAEQQLLRKASRNGYAAINAHFTIAMMRLATRDREGAIRHFTACTDTIAIGNFSYEMAAAFRLRMEADPTWPNWLHQTAD